MGDRIFFFTDDPGAGGAAQYNHAMIAGLIAAGYQVTTLYTSPEVVLEQMKLLGLQGAGLAGIHLSGTEAIIAKLTEKPDLVVCSNSYPLSNLTVKQVAIDLGLPFVVIEHFVDPEVADRNPIYLEELARQYRHANAVIAVSQENLDTLRQRFGLPSGQGQVIHYGRPDPYFTPIDPTLRQRLRQELEIPADAVVCLTAARLELRKGYQYQLEAIAELIHRPVWSQLYFVWIGGGIFQPQVETDLREAIAALGAADRVKFLGQRQDVVDWLNIADLFVFPSQREGMPICVMEAMAKGLPVIASAVSGIPEELADTGKLLPDPNQDEAATVTTLVNTIQAWVEQPQLRQEMGRACQHRASLMFRESRMIDATLAVLKAVSFPVGDYVSPGFRQVRPDAHFPNMVVGDPATCGWAYLRREIPHNWYVDQREPIVGFVSRDEAHILYNTALQFQGKQALEIGCWLGWSACHLALAGVELDVVDPLLAKPEFYAAVSGSLAAAGVLERTRLHPGYSPQAVLQLAASGKKWSLIFIDGNHEAPGPLEDAIACLPLAEPDALVLFHDLASPDVAQGLDYYRDQGWQTLVYQTAQIMGVAWRGNVRPVEHQPDPAIAWELPDHLQSYPVSGIGAMPVSAEAEFEAILAIIRPYTLLSRERLFSLYTLARRVCLQDIPGNFVECGTYKGGAAALLATVIQRYSQRPRHLYAFDTFAGMPEPTDVDRHRGLAANDTNFGAGTLVAPLENLHQVCGLLGVGTIVVPVPGLFAETLPQQRPTMGEIALLHADGDWYESTLDIFNTLYDSLVPRSLVQIDDYGYWEGCRKAIHDFEQQRGLVFKLYRIDDTGVWFAQSEVTPATPQNPLHEAIALFNAQQTVAAMRLAEQIAATEPTLPGLNYLRSLCFSQLGRHREALEAVKAELAIDPNHVKAQEQLTVLSRGGQSHRSDLPSDQRPWNTALPTDLLYSIQNATYHYSYRGVPLIKNPFDFALYPLLLWNLRPRTILEIGSKDGGSALWLGDMLQNFGLEAHIYSIDVVKVTAVEHPRVTFLEGDGRALAQTLSQEFLRSLPRPWLIIEDADHSYETSKQVLQFFHPHLQVGEYIVVEDGIISDLVLDESYNTGPHQALKEFLAYQGAEYEIDSQYCDYFGYNLTWSTNGFLRKVNPTSSQATLRVPEIHQQSPTIVVDGVFFQLYKTGIARVWRSLLEAWATTDFAQHLVILDRARTAPKIPGLRYLTIPPYNYAATDSDRELLQQICDDEGADLFISSYYTTPISTPSVFMAYDMIPEVMGANFDEPMWREKHYGIEHASTFITISENTARDLVQFFPSIGADAVTVAHCGVSPIFQPATATELQQFKLKYGITRPYFMLAGLGIGYKNSALFFTAFAQMVSQPGFDIVCTGVTSQHKSEFASAVPESTIHALQLSDEELRLAYAGAVALVYPSKYEGFGLPIVEALASGCPVITCPNASIPEVAGAAAIYVSDTDAEALTEALCEVQKPSVRRQLIAAGLAQAQKFSWSEMAEKVATALIQTTLIPLELNEINLLIVPDWTQPEARLGESLAATLRAIATHPDRNRITLLVTRGAASEEEANLMLSGVAMNLLLEAELDVSDGLGITLLPPLSQRQWQALRPRIQARLVLEPEDAEMITTAQLDTLPSQPLESFAVLADI